MEKNASPFLRRALIPGMALSLVALAHGDSASSGKGNETILTGGQAAVVNDKGVKVIPISTVPSKLNGTLDDPNKKSAH
jgi:hypothetical protein